MTQPVGTVVMVLESPYPTSGGGGAETQVRTLTKHLGDRNVRSMVWTPLTLYCVNRSTHDSVDGVPVWRISYPRIPALGAMLMLLRLAHALVTRRGEYDAIHAHIAGNMAAVCCLVGRLLGKPVVVKLTGLTEMSGGIIDPSAGFTTRVRRSAIRHATHVHAISRRIVDGLIACGFDRERIRHMPNALDVDRFQPREGARPTLQALTGRSRVGVYVGRLQPEKNLEFMLRGWARCLRHRTDTALLLLGRGVQEEALRSLCAELGIADQVVFVGATPEVEKYLRAADFGILASRAEGLSNTLLEYMASGLPVLGSRVSGNEDYIVDGQTGWLFDVDDDAGFDRGLTQAAALEPAALQGLGQAARRAVLTTAAVPVVVAGLMGMYGFTPPEQEAERRFGGSKSCVE